MNEPKLRFPEFSGEWEEKKVKEIFEITRGQVLPAEKTKPEADGLYKYPVYSSQTMRNGLMGYYNEALFNNAITWTTDGANAGTVRYRKGDFYCTNVCGVLLSKDGYANECIAELLNIICKSHVSFVGNPKLMNNVMAEIVIPIPSLQEQEKIASCLSAMDELIAAQAEKVEALKEKKTGMMQQLFPQPGETTPRLRFPEFTGEWEEKKVKEIFEITRGQVLPAEKTKPEADGLYKYPVYSSQTMRNGLMGYYNEALFNNAITWTTDGANAGTVRYRKGDFYCTNVCGVLLSKDGYANECIAELLNIICKSHVSFVGNPKLMNNVMAEIVIPIPSLQEQQKIADCLSALDDQIAAETEKITALKDYKKGLMQQLFPQPAK